MQRAPINQLLKIQLFQGKKDLSLSQLVSDELVQLLQSNKVPFTNIINVYNSQPSKPRSTKTMNIIYFISTKSHMGLWHIRLDVDNLVMHTKKAHYSNNKKTK